MSVSADAAVSTYTQTARSINSGGASVFIGEQGLDLTTTLTAARTVAVPATTSTQIGWWASAAVITTTAPTISTDLQGQVTNYQISPATFVGYTGNWYLLTTNGQAATDATGRPIVVFNVKDPSLAIKVWDYDNSADVTGGSVTQGERLGFGIETNMYSALDARYRAPVYNRAGVNADNVGDGYIMIRMTDESGTTFASLISSGGISHPLAYLNVSVQPYKWGTEFGNNYNWDTGSKVSASTDYVYTPGTYTVFAESWLNNMKNNYKNGGSTYTGKTISATQTITLMTDTESFTGTPTSGTAPLTVQFTDCSTSSPTSWRWDFGDGSSSTSQNPVHTYAWDGSYTVSLTVTYSAGSITYTRTNYISVGSGVSYTQTARSINAGGASVYIGEQGLDLTGTLAAARAVAVPATTSTQIGWWASAAVITTTAPTISTDLQGQVTNYQISPATFVGYTGNWYLLTTNGQAAVDAAGRPVVVFNVKDPSLAIKVWDYDNSADITGGSVTQCERLGFGIETNTYSALDARYRAPIYNRAGVLADNVGDGYIMIRMTDESGTTFASLIRSGGISHPLAYLNVSVQPYKWGTEFGNNYNWDTGSKVSASTDYVYQTGTYTVFAESWLNNMKNNYKNGGSTYTGKTISETKTITLPDAGSVPVANFVGAPTSGTAPLTVTFTDCSTNTPTSWYWDFGDGSSSALQNPSHRYTSTDTFTVALTATNSAGSNVCTKTNYITVTAAAASANVGVFRDGSFYLKDATAFGYGLTGDFPIAGDWDGDGVDTGGVFRNGSFYLKDGPSFSYGLTGDKPVAGNWTGDRTTEVGVFRDGLFFLRNSTGGTEWFAYGQAGDTPIAGDWNGDGTTKVGVFRDGVFYLRANDGSTYAQFGWGLIGDSPIAGDWNGDRKTEVGVFRDGSFYLIAPDGSTYSAFGYGLTGDTPIAGKWVSTYTITFTQSMQILNGPSATVPIGTTVIWKNEDSLKPHGLQATDIQDGAWLNGATSASIPFGKTLEVTFNNAGAYDYTTVFQPEQSGVITVK